MRILRPIENGKRGFQVCVKNPGKKVFPAPKVDPLTGPRCGSCKCGGDVFDLAEDLRWLDWRVCGKCTAEQ